MWFDNWFDIWRVVLVGMASYVSLVILIRVSGKRALAQMNAFDFVVTVALGSTLATILLSKDVSFLEGLTAIALLLALQVIVALLVQRSVRVRRVITSGPSRLLRDGEMDDNALRRHRVARADVLQAVRESGTGDLSTVAAVVLESDGKLSVIPRAKMGDGSSLRGVE